MEIKILRVEKERGSVAHRMLACSKFMIEEMIRCNQDVDENLFLSLQYLNQVIDIVDLVNQKDLNILNEDVDLSSVVQG